MPRSTQSLDTTQIEFRFDMNLSTARAYLQAALEYSYDYMIGPDEFQSIAKEIHDWLRFR